MIGVLSRISNVWFLINKINNGMSSIVSLIHNDHCHYFLNYVYPTTVSQSIKNSKCIIYYTLLKSTNSVQNATKGSLLESGDLGRGC